MAQITKTVDKTSVQGSETFIYTYNVSFSGLTEPAQDGKLVDIFPSKILFILPQIGSLIKNITQVPVPGGTEVTFDFGAVDAGTSLFFTVACSFGPGRVDNDSFTNTADLFADNVKVATATAPTVHLTLIEAFKIEKKHQGSNIVRPGDIVTFSISIFNSGDAGAKITNVDITDILPPELIPVTSYLPTGNDASSAGYSDHTYDGLTGTWNGNTLHFFLPSFRGNRYTINFKATVSNDVVPGQTIFNDANWTVNGQSRQNSRDTLIVFSPEYIFSLTKGAPRTGAVGTPMLYTINNSNRDIISHTNYQILDTLPDEVDITKLKFTSNSAGIPSYSIFIALSNNPTTFIPVIQNASGNTPSTDLTPFITPGTNIKYVKVTAPTLNPTNSAHTLALSGVINSKAQLIIDNPNIPSKVIINYASATADGLAANTSVGTDLSGASDLIINKGIIPSQAAYAPLDEFQYLLRSGPLNTFTIDPVFADLLPTEVYYVPNSEYFVYVDNFSGITYDSRQPNFPVPLPVKDEIENYNGTGRTLLRWRFDGFTLGTGTSLQVIFKCFIKIGAQGQITNDSYLGNPGDNILFVYTGVIDTNDFDGDGITDEYISHAASTNIVLISSEFIIKKLVKGDQDLDYSSSGHVTPGGEIDYEFFITNNQDIDLKNIELVDILPYVGDTGVILTGTPRGSQFDVYATSAVTAQIVNVMGDPVESNPEIIVEYSTSNNPVRFDQQGNPIGTGTWSTTPPADITTLRSIRVTTGSNVLLHPYERLIVTIKAKAPVNTPINKIAYNSFAVRADRVNADQSTEPLLPTEPNKVGVQTISTNKSSIGQFVWNDINGNGIYDDNEPGVNGVTVELYDQNKNLLATTITSNNNNNQPGYYIFNNLNASNYYVKFIPYGDYKLTQQQASQPNGSKPYPATGFTDVIVLGTNENRTDINAGVLTEICNPPTISAHDKCIHVGDTFNPMTDVMATDCMGNDITSDIIVIYNNVNNKVPGIYTVTYKVSDQYNQTTLKTISVKVCSNGPFDQAVTDIVESVALEQAALRTILDAEGQKIQKSLTLNLSDSEEKCLTESIKDMIKEITHLEIILHGKLDIFSCLLCKDCCKDSSNCSCKNS